MTNKCIQTSRQ